MDILKTTTQDDPSNVSCEIDTAVYETVFNNCIHYHSFFEFELMISGKGTYEINNVSYDIKPGMLFLTTPADYHTYSISKGDSITFYNIQFFSECLSEKISSHLYSYTEPIALELDGDDLALFTDHVTRIINAFSEKGPFYDVILRNEIENLCVRIICMMRRKSDESTYYSFIKKTIVYIKQNYREAITLKKVAGYVGLSEKYLSHIFSESVGIGFSSYVRQVRLDAAANLLKSTTLSVKEICYKVGFSNQNYFTDSFRVHFGESPRKYRENYRKNIK